MSKFVVIVFPGESQAYQGTRALKELHAEGSLTVYGMAVISKDAQGSLSVKEAADAGPLGMAVYGVGADFVSKVSTELRPGKSAVVAEIAEYWTIPLDTRMQSLNGTVLRTWRADFENEQIGQEIAARNADLEQLHAEYAQASAETKAKLKAKVEQAKTELERAQKRVKDRLDALEKEVNAKVAALEQQVTKAQADAREKIKQRMAAARAEYETRSAKLKQAWALTKQALAA